MSQSGNVSSGIPTTAIGLAAGLVVGGLVGLIIGNPIVFAGGGMVLGLSIGYALDKGRGENV